MEFARTRSHARLFPLNLSHRLLQPHLIAELLENSPSRKAALTLTPSTTTPPLHVTFQPGGVAPNLLLSVTFLLRVPISRRNTPLAAMTPAMIRRGAWLERWPRSFVTSQRVGANQRRGGLDRSQWGRDGREAGGRGERDFVLHVRWRRTWESEAFLDRKKKKRSGGGFYGK